MSLSDKIRPTQSVSPTLYGDLQGVDGWLHKEDVRESVMRIKEKLSINTNVAYTPMAHKFVCDIIDEEMGEKLI